MTRYAERTEVSSEKSKQEIERTLRRYGATEFAYGWDANRAMIGFALRTRLIRFLLPMPDRNDDAFRLTPTRKVRVPSAAEAEYERAVRQRWRALALVIKAKLEAVEAGITTIDEEFLAHMVLPSGETIGQRFIPQLEALHERGQLPQLMPGDPS